MQHRRRLHIFQAAKRAFNQSNALKSLSMPIDKHPQQAASGR